MKTTLICSLGLMLVSAVPASSEEGGAPNPKPASAPAPAAAAPAPSAPAGNSTTATKPIDWKGMNEKQRKDYMRKTVVPTMRKLFAAFDAKKYKRISCPTCHGDSVNKAYEMPNPELPVLPSDPAGFKALGEKKPDAMTFMATKVKPTMAQLLGKPESTKEHPDGFGCFACHTKDVGQNAPTK